ncbi:MAG: hypothetical protein K2P76_12660 [Lachnospiraceae bacterium]|nr:hypothetical protein [Lachnospiraceae bacterium]MDE6980689.1 hypothetical protein [Lachnospiraceae bacterium]
MLDSKSKRRQDERLFQGKQGNKRHVLEHTSQMELDDTIAGRTLGYTRDARVYVGQELKREYKY